MAFDLSSLGWDDAFATTFARLARRRAQHHCEPPPRGRCELRPARVSQVDRGVCTVLSADGPLRASLAGALLAEAAADPMVLPCAGDWVAVRTWPDARLTLEAVLPRRTAIVRAGVGEAPEGQVLAANLDTVAVVEPMAPHGCVSRPDLGRVERLLDLAWQSGARPIVVLTKSDLAADPTAVAEQVARAYPGVEVLAVSIRASLEPLRPFIVDGQTLGLLGPSGAGKSSLVNALVGAAVMGTQPLRADGRGKHTTTRRALVPPPLVPPPLVSPPLVPLPGGGAILDTPGLLLVGQEQSLDRARKIVIRRG